MMFLDVLFFLLHFLLLAHVSCVVDAIQAAIATGPGSGGTVAVSHTPPSLPRTMAGKGKRKTLQSYSPSHVDLPGSAC